jgi:hypothetical protein
MHHQFNIQQLYDLPTLYLCVLYLSESKQRLDIHQHRVTNTKCRTDSSFSLWLAHSSPKHVQKRNKSYLRKIVHQVDFIYKIVY